MVRKKVQEDAHLESRITLQDWKGLAIVEDRVGNTGETVFTTLPFKKNEVVCDYHGPIISHGRGEELMNTMAAGKIVRWAKKWYQIDMCGHRFCTLHFSPFCQSKPVRIKRGFGGRATHCVIVGVCMHTLGCLGSEHTQVHP